MNKLGDRVFCNLYPHSVQLSDRMDFIKEFAKNCGSLTLTHSQISKLWSDVIICNPIASDHKVLADWLKVICDDFLLGRNTGTIAYDDLLAFFTSTICSTENSYSNLNLEGYYCIQGFFLLLNLRAQKLMALDDDITKAMAGPLKHWEITSVQYRKIDPDLIAVTACVAPNEMEGIEVLWKIAIDC